MPARTQEKTDRHHPHLVERDRMLDVVTVALQVSPGQTGSSILIAGETGTGKSSLIRGALETVPDSKTDSPLRAVVGCHPSTIPYAAWISLIENHPVLEECVPAPLGSREPAAQGSEELIHQTARAICQLAASQPLALVFDDIQWADVSSLELILAIARQLDDQPAALALILSCETPLREGTPVANFIPNLLRETHTQSIELRALSTDGIRQLIAHRFSNINETSLQEIVNRIQLWSGGNPLYVSEMLDGLEDRGEIADLGGRGLDSLTFSLRQFAEYRLSQISDDARETLEMASIVGDLIDIDLLADVSGFEMNQLIDNLEEALDHGILLEEHSNQVRFRHGIVRQMLASRQSGIRRRHSHLAVLEALQRRKQSLPLDIARHAEAAGEYETAVSALEQAAHRARELFNLPEAARSLRQALDLAERAHLDPSEEDRLRLQYADSIVRNTPSGAAREYERVAARAYVSGDRLTLARARQRQATLLYETGRRHEAQSMLDGLIPDLEDLEDWETLAEALSCALYCASSVCDFDTVNDLSAQLESVAARISAPSYRAVAVHTRALADVASGNPADGTIAVRDSIAMAMELGQLDIATPWTAVAFFKVDLLANLHRPDEVESLIQRGTELDAESNRRIGLSPGDCDCTPEFSYWWFLRGEWDRVHDVLPDPISIRTDPQPQVLKDSVQIIAAEWALAQGRIEDATSYLDYVAPSPGTPPGDHGYQQWLMAVEMKVRLAIQRGDLNEVESWIEAFDQELETKSHVPGELMLELSKARLQLARSEAETVREITSSVISQARRTQNMLALIAALQLQAQAYRQMGNWESAMGAAAEAIVAAGQCKLDYLQSLGKIIRLEIAHAFGDNSDLRRAEIEDLIEKMESLGAEPALERLRKLVPRERQGKQFGLTRREIEVLRLVAEGKTDNEVAESLYISPRTASTHVGNMLNKTGTNNRVELASWAHQNNVLA